MNLLLKQFYISFRLTAADAPCVPWDLVMSALDDDDDEDDLALVIISIIITISNINVTIIINATADGGAPFRPL